MKGKKILYVLMAIVMVIVISNLGYFVSNQARAASIDLYDKPLVKATISNEALLFSEQDQVCDELLEFSLDSSEYEYYEHTIPNHENVSEVTSGLAIEPTSIQGSGEQRFAPPMGGPMYIRINSRELFEEGLLPYPLPQIPPFTLPYCAPSWVNVQVRPAMYCEFFMRAYIRIIIDENPGTSRREGTVILRYRIRRILDFDLIGITPEYGTVRVNIVQEGHTLSISSTGWTASANGGARGLM